jgi:hypothetical protein
MKCKSRNILHISLSVFVCACVRVRKRVRKHYSLLTFVASLAPPHFSTLSDKRHDFRKKITEYKTYVLIFSTTSTVNEFSEILS